jgi:seryl-tRNA synthetase
MLDINLLRKDLPWLVSRLEARKKPQPFLDVDAFITLEAERKSIQTRTEELQAQRNQLSKQIGQLKSKGQPVDPVMAQVASLKSELESSAARLEQIQPELQALLLSVPNLPHESVPAGADESANVEVRKWGTPRAYEFAVKDHVDVGERL